MLRHLPTIRAEIETGYAELRPDPDVESAWTLLVNGVPQSHVDLKDPQLIAFDYVRRMADVIEVLAPPGPLDVLHLGGGAMTLPRCLAAMRPGSVQSVVELDAKLLRLVLDYLPLDGQDGIETVVGDAAEAVAATPARRHDVVVCDVFQGSRVPPQVSNAEFAVAVAGALKPRGLYVVNLMDAAPLSSARAQAGILARVFARVAVVAEAAVLRGRRQGNLILVAADESGLPTREAASRVASHAQCIAGRRGRHPDDLDPRSGQDSGLDDGATQGRSASRVASHAQSIAGRRCRHPDDLDPRSGQDSGLDDGATQGRSASRVASHAQSIGVSFDTLVRRLAADPFAVRVELGDRLESFIRG